MKTITIQNVQIEEIIIRPNDTTPVTASYKVLDNTGAVVSTKRINIAQSDAPGPIAGIANKILQLALKNEGL